MPALDSLQEPPSTEGASPAIGSIRTRLAGMIRSAVLRRVLLLIGGASGAQLIGLAAAPLIARLYTPAEFGILGIYTSLLAIFCAAATLRYECALPIARDGEETASLLILVLGTAVVTSSGVGLLLGGLSPHLPGRIQLLGSFWWLLPPGMFLTAVYQALSYWALREQRFKALASTKVAQAGGMIAIQTGAGALTLGPGWLIAGHIAGQSLGFGTLGRLALRKHRDAFHTISTRSIAAVARRYRRFPRYSSGAAVLDALGGSMPLIFLASMYGPTLAGWLTIVYRLNVPLGVVSNAVGQVNFADMAGIMRSDRKSLRGIFARRLTVLIACATLVVGVMNLLVPFLVPVLLGPRWNNVTPCLQVMSPLFFAGFVASPLGFALEVTERQDMHLYRELFRAGVMGIALAIVALLRPSWVGAVAIVSTAGTINYVGYLLASWIAIVQLDRTSLPFQSAGAMTKSC